MFNQTVLQKFMLSPNLSFEAKGLLLSLFTEPPQQWTLADIIALSNDSETVTQQILAEVLAANFVLQTGENYYLSNKAKTLQQALIT